MPVCASLLAELDRSELTHCAEPLSSQSSMFIVIELLEVVVASVSLLELPLPGLWNLTVYIVPMLGLLLD